MFMYTREPVKSTSLLSMSTVGADFPANWLKPQK